MKYGMKTICIDAEIEECTQNPGPYPEFEGCDVLELCLRIKELYEENMNLKTQLINTDKSSNRSLTTVMWASPEPKVQMGKFETYGYWWDGKFRSYVELPVCTYPASIPQDSAFQYDDKSFDTCKQKIPNNGFFCSYDAGAAGDRENEL